MNLGDPLQLGPYRLTGRLWDAGSMVTFSSRPERGAIYLDAWRHTGSARVDVAAFATQIRNGPRPSAVPIDGGVDGDWAWIATAAGDSRVLADDVATDGAFGSRTWKHVAAALADELSGLHDAGHVVGRLLPTDVVVRGESGALRSLAVVYARLLGDEGPALPPVAWMAPELLDGAEPDSATDSFCLGALLAFAATGRRPWGPESTPTAVLVQRILDGEIDLAGVDAERQQVVRDLTAADPGQRLDLGALADLVAGDVVPDPFVDAPPPPAPTNPLVAVNRVEPVDGPRANVIPGLPAPIRPPEGYDQEAVSERGGRGPLLAVIAGAVVLVVIALTAAFAFFGGRGESAADPTPRPSSAASATPDPTKTTPATPTPSPTPEMTPSVRVNYGSAAIPDKVFVGTLDWVFDVCSTDANLLSPATLQKVALYQRVDDGWRRVPAEPEAVRGGRCGADKVNLTLGATAQRPPGGGSSGLWSVCAGYRVVIPATKRFDKTYVDMCVQTRMDGE